MARSKWVQILLGENSARALHEEASKEKTSEITNRHDAWEKIRQAKFHRILGLIFDEKLSWQPHMTGVKKRVQPRLKLLRSLATTKYGADQDILIRTFTSLVVTTIEFGSPAYGSARQKVLDQLQTIFNEGLRIALGHLELQGLQTSLMKLE